MSQDKWSRHLAVATYSHRACILRVWRIKDLLELGPENDEDLNLSINVTHTLTDRYDSKRRGQSNWLIKV